MQNAELKKAVEKIIKASSNVKILIASREEAFQIEYYYLHIVHELDDISALSLLDQKLS